jgi:hypothetical protein
MTKSRKQQSTSGVPDETGNISSAEIEQVHSWTDEEMAAAKPIPLPTVESTPQVAGVAGVPHAGKGQTTPGGRPEKDNAKC